MEYNNTLENIMPTLKSKSVRMIFADFPFSTTMCKWGTPVDLELFWKEAWRILLDDGVVIAKAQPPFNITLGVSQLKYFILLKNMIKILILKNLNRKFVTLVFVN